MKFFVVTGFWNGQVGDVSQIAGHRKPWSLSSDSKLYIHFTKSFKLLLQVSYSKLIWSTVAACGFRFFVLSA